MGEVNQKKTLILIEDPAALESRRICTDRKRKGGNEEKGRHRKGLR